MFLSSSTLYVLAVGLSSLVDAFITFDVCKTLAAKATIFRMGNLKSFSTVKLEFTISLWSQGQDPYFKYESADLFTASVVANPFFVHFEELHHEIDKNLKEPYGYAKEYRLFVLNNFFGPPDLSQSEDSLVSSESDDEGESTGSDDEDNGRKPIWLSIHVPECHHYGLGVIRTELFVPSNVLAAR